MGASSNEVRNLSSASASATSRCLAIGDVVQIGDDAGHVGVVEQVGDRDVEPPPRPVGGPDAQLEGEAAPRRSICAASKLRRHPLQVVGVGQVAPEHATPPGLGS